MKPPLILLLTAFILLMSFTGKLIANNILSLQLHMRLSHLDFAQLLSATAPQAAAATRADVRRIVFVSGLSENSPATR